MYKVPELETAYLSLCGHLTYADDDLTTLIELLHKYSDIDDPEENKIDHDIYVSLECHLTDVRANVDRIRSILLDCI